MTKESGQVSAEIEVTPEMVEAMTAFFWKWRAENIGAVVNYDHEPDIRSLYDGLRSINVGHPLAVVDAR